MGLVYEALDTLLEVTVVGSYSAIGYRLRRPFWDAGDLHVSLAGKVALVTGANSGIGRATATGLARLGATVVMACRSMAKGEEARTAILAETKADPDDVIVEPLDLASLASVRACADRVRERFSALHVLVNNAGVMLHERLLTEDGIEANFQTNVLGAFLLTNRLAPLLVAGAPARIVHVTSGGMYTQKLDVNDLQSTRLDPWDGVAAYAQNKRAQVLLNETWADKLRARGVTSNAMHPGWADTPVVARALPRFHALLGPVLRDWEQGADTVVWLAASPRVAGETGKLFFDRRPRKATLFAKNAPVAGDHERLWSECVRLSGQDLAL